MRAVFYLLPLYIKSDDAWELGRLLRALDTRNRRVLVLDRARSFVHNLHQALRDAERIRSVEDLQQFAGQGGGIGVAEIIKGLVGADVHGLEAMVVCRTYLSNYAAQRSIIVPIMLHKIRLEPKDVFDDNPLDALRLEALESVLYDLAIVAGRAVRSEGDEYPFTVLLGAGTVVRVAQNYPDHAMEIYENFVETFKDELDPEVRVYDLGSKSEVPLEELEDVEVKKFEELSEDERKELVNWMNGQIAVR
ncbi:hypothetical protein [Methanopyrus kandleri]|uniref:Uncharacterized protein n=2 Tax=Methanopyrus kandleri TaxID=2320 RepID=Q8TVI7_METKA|nr:hypothetical protein [Methanopyrus kandleri]AAM02615.1 Uncharacterized protein MK1402 [Methanopyrus kandleri AV19]HII70269.1 hypothetical protein [Methanopyrus kandleri]